MAGNGEARPRRVTAILVLAVLASAGVAALGGAAVYMEHKALSERAASRAALAATDPYNEPGKTIAAAEAYLDNPVRRPNEDQVRWALARYEAALRRKTALALIANPDAIDAEVARYRATRDTALAPFIKAEAHR